MPINQITSQIYSNFKFEPTLSQKKTIEKLGDWVVGGDYEKIFILNGYAGSGKTSIIAALVAAMRGVKISSVLMAPTGRAAKVMGHYADSKTYTIHKRIYRQKSLDDPESDFTLNFNKDQDVVYIVDEASMLSDQSSGEFHLFGSGSLLDDLITYVRSGKRCRLLIVGDSAQLPPIGREKSPALDPSLMERYGDVEYVSLDDVVRQQEDSGILFNATLVRCMLEGGIYERPRFDLSFKDVKRVGGEDLLSELESCYSLYGKDETIVITRSNKRAGRFNQGIRYKTLYAEERIESGDMLMVVKNNYHYKPAEKDSRMEFIANGDIARLKRIRRFEPLYGFDFAEVTLEFPDYDNAELDCKIMLDTLESDSPSLGRDEGDRLFKAILGDYEHLKNKRYRYRKVFENEHFNALQIKFAYAITCHKAQGGQWSAVFIDRMLFGDEPMSIDLLRWLYTAITRASERVYFVNFDDTFFDGVKSDDW